MELPTPFHGNHPKYNDYVREKIRDLAATGPLSLDRLADLQKTLKNELQGLLDSGNVERLNDYYREVVKRL